MHTICRAEGYQESSRSKLADYFKFQIAYIQNLSDTLKFCSQVFYYISNTTEQVISKLIISSATNCI